MKYAAMPGVLLTLLGLAVAPDLHAIQNCGNQNFKGTYGILARGSFVGAPFPPLTLAMTGQIVADGRGNVSAPNTLTSYGGAVLPRDLAGTYTVFPDCTVTFNLLASPLPGETGPTPLGFTGAIADNGREVGHLLASPPGTAVYILLRAQNRRYCSNQDLRGGFLLNMSGIITFGVPSGLFNRVGKLEFDGRGGFSANTHVSYNGVIVPEAFSGTYAVEPSCKITLQYTFGPAHTWVGALTDNSTGATLLVASPQGAVVAGTLKQQ